MPKRIGQRNILPLGVKNRNMDNIILGGNNNVDGSLTIKDATGAIRVTLTKDGFVWNDGTNDRILIGDE
jgi:hypothetical protein